MSTHSFSATPPQYSLSRSCRKPHMPKTTLNAEISLVYPWPRPLKGSRNVGEHGCIVLYVIGILPRYTNINLAKFMCIILILYTYVIHERYLYYNNIIKINFHNVISIRFINVWSMSKAFFKHHFQFLFTLLIVITMILDTVSLLCDLVIIFWSNR